MKSLHRAALVAALPLLFIACASTPAAFKPTEVQAAGMPYEGLNENSYGTRSTTQFRHCDPQDDAANTPNLAPDGRARVAEFASGLAASTTKVVGTPLQGMTKVDSTLVRLGLDSAFRLPSDSSHPPVAVLAHADDSIVFWHSAKLVPLAEVNAAARAYCAKRQRPLLYRGSATRCPKVERGLAGQPILHTYAVSAYACAAR